MQVKRFHTQMNEGSNNVTAMQVLIICLREGRITTACMLAFWDLLYFGKFASKFRSLIFCVHFGAFLEGLQTFRTVSRGLFEVAFSVHFLVDMSSVYFLSVLSAESL